MMVSNRKLLFQVSIFGCHVSFRGCIRIVTPFITRSGPPCMAAMAFLLSPYKSHGPFSIGRTSYWALGGPDFEQKALTQPERNMK